MDPIIEQLRVQQEELVAESNTIIAAADAEKRDLTDEELSKVKANKSEFERMKAHIEARESVAAQADELSQPQGRITDPDSALRAEADGDDGVPSRPQGRAEQARQQDRPAAPARPRASGAHVVGDRSRLSGTFGFRAMGDYFMAVKNAGISRNANMDGRLMAAVTSSGNESSGSDGGFAVPPDYRAQIMERVFGEDSLVSRTDRQNIGGNSLTFPADMTTPWGTDGVQAYWTGEGDSITQSRPKLEEVTVRAHKLAALVYMTDELLEDATAMGSFIGRKAGEKIDFKLANAIAWGSGVGSPLGFMNAPCLVTQTEESSQTADTIVAGNVSKMLRRLPMQSRRNAIWLIHPEAESQLDVMTIGDKPVYIPPGGLRDAPFGILLGRPVIPHQVCKQLGDLGDIILADLTQYLSVMKSGGLRSETSIHVAFDTDHTAFRFIFRIGGQPWWSAPIAALNGTFTQSPFVTLEART